MKGADIGCLGESLATNFLIKAGMVVIRKNYQVKKIGEIDLLMSDGEDIVLVEVKSSLQNGNIDRGIFGPLDRLNNKKQKKLLLLAKYISGQYQDKNIRIDAVEVIIFQDKKIGRCRHLKNIAWL